MKHGCSPASIAGCPWRRAEFQSWRGSVNQMLRSGQTRDADKLTLFLPFRTTRVLIPPLRDVASTPAERTMDQQQSVEMILARQLTGYLSVPVLLVDTAGTVIFYNEPAERILGVRFE